LNRNNVGLEMSSAPAPSIDSKPLDPHRRRLARARSDTGTRARIPANLRAQAGESDDLAEAPRQIDELEHVRRVPLHRRDPDVVGELPPALSASRGASTQT
jgi:hypothetical protein